jgi:hypothetical protein
MPQAKVGQHGQVSLAVVFVAGLARWQYCQPHSGEPGINAAGGCPRPPLPIPRTRVTTCHGALPAASAAARRIGIALVPCNTLAVPPVDPRPSGRTPIGHGFSIARLLTIKTIDANQWIHRELIALATASLAAASGRAGMIRHHLRQSARFPCNIEPTKRTARSRSCHGHHSAWAWSASGYSGNQLLAQVWG